MGVRKTLSKIRQQYYWPGLQKDVRHYIRGCEICTKSKSSTKTKRAPMKTLGAGIPIERIALDIVGELPRTENGNRYILVICDYFTKWVEAFAMPNMETVTIARLLVREVLTRFGIPSSLHSDQGKQFEGNIFTEMCKVLNIKKTRTSPYHPQCDGLVERFNKTLITMLRSLVDEHQSDWDELLPYVLMAYRSVEQESTGFSPNYLMFGREVRTPLDIAFEMPSQIKDIPLQQWVWDLKEKMEMAHTFVRENSFGSMLRQKSFHDTKLSWNTFSPGDEVYVYFPRYAVGKSPKLTQFWKGPYRVKDKWSDVSYRVNCGPYGKPQVIHVDRMRPKRAQSFQDEETSSSNPIAADDQNDTAELDELKSEDCERLSDRFRERRRPKYLSDYVVEL